VADARTVGVGSILGVGDDKRRARVAEWNLTELVQLASALAADELEHARRSRRTDAQGLPIWQEKMEATWELTDCHPPPPRAGPFELMELCKAPLVCCGNEFVNLTLDSGQKVRKCVDRCVTDANDCSL
jgi:hypothetical protein